MGTPPRSRPGAASRFGTTDRPATSTGLLHRPTSSSFAVKTAGPGRSSLAHDAIEERPSRRPATSSNATANNRGLGSRPMSASKERLMGSTHPSGSSPWRRPEQRPGARRTDGTESRDPREGDRRRRDLYDYNGRRIDPQRARDGGDDDDARGVVHAEVRSTGTRRRRLPRESRGARAPNERDRARRRARAGARPPRAQHPTSRNTTATAGGSLATGGCDATSRSRRRREAAAATVIRKNSVGRIRGGTPQEGSRPSAALDGDRGAREQERQVDVERAGPTRVRYRPGGLGIDHRDPARKSRTEKGKKTKKPAGGLPPLEEAGGTTTTRMRRTRRTECRTTNAAAGWTRRWTRAPGSRRPEATTTAMRRRSVSAPRSRHRQIPGANAVLLEGTGREHGDGRAHPHPHPQTRRASEAAASARAGSSAAGTAPRLRARRRRRLGRRRPMTVTMTVTSAPRSSSSRCDARFRPRSRPPPRPRASTLIVAPNTRAGDDEKFCSGWGVEAVVRGCHAGETRDESRRVRARASRGLPVGDGSAAQSASGTPGGGYGIGLDAAHADYLQQMHQYQYHQYQQYQQTQQTHQMQQPMQLTQQPMQQHGYHQPQPAHPGFQYHQQARQQFHQPVTANDDFQATLARAQALRTPRRRRSWRLPTAARASGSTRVRRRAGTSTTIQTIATCRTRRISSRPSPGGFYPGRAYAARRRRGGGVSEVRRSVLSVDT